MNHHLPRHKHAKKLTLRRDLNLFNATAAGVGIIVGAGIYALIGAAAGLAGNGVWISFLIAAFVAALTGLSYAELSSMFQGGDGEYSYIKNAMSASIAFVVGYLVVMQGITGAAAVSLGFAGYLHSLIGVGNLIIIGIAAIILFSIINYIGIKQSARLNVIFTFLEVAALIAIILLGIKYIGKVNYLDYPSLSGVLTASSLIFFAYTGFESIIKLSEETKNAKKTIPTALILSIAITTVIYILVGITAVSIVGWKELASSAAPLALVANTLLGQKALLVLSIIALFATGNTILILLVTTSRMMYGMGNDIRKLNFLSKINSKTQTPYIAVILTGLLSLAFVLFGKKIDVIANVANFIIFFSFFFVNLSVIILRYKNNMKRGFKIPLNIGKFQVLPLIGALFCIFMITNIEWKITVAGFVLVAVGFVIYYLICKPKSRSRIMECSVKKTVKRNLKRNYS